MIQVVRPDDYAARRGFVLADGSFVVGAVLVKYLRRNERRFIVFASRNRLRGLAPHQTTALMADIESLLGSITPLVRDYGAVAVMIVLTLESLGMPLPGETLLIFASALAAHGDISFPSLLVLAWTGAVLGDNIGYTIGKVFGRHLVLRYGGIIGLNAKRMSTVEALFARYGAVTVCFARFFSILRQLNGIVAGTLGMDWRKFLAFNALGGALWVLAWSLAGFYLGENLTNITSIAYHLEGIGAIFAVVAIIIAIAYTRHRQQRGSGRPHRED